MLCGTKPFTATKKKNACNKNGYKTNFPRIPTWSIKLFKIKGNFHRTRVFYCFILLFMTFKGNSSVERKTYVFAALFRHFFALHSNPLRLADGLEWKTTVILLLVYQEHPIIRHIPPAMAKWDTYNIFPSMRAIQTTSHKINHKEVSISQKKCRIHNIKANGEKLLFNLTSHKIHCMYKCLITHYAMFCLKSMCFKYTCKFVPREQRETRE